MAKGEAVTDQAPITGEGRDVRMLDELCALVARTRSYARRYRE